MNANRKQPARRGTIRIVDGKVVRTEETIGAGSKTEAPPINVNNYRTLHSRGRGDRAAG